MVKILSSKEVQDLLNRNRRRIWITKDMGEQAVKFLSPIYSIASGEEDLSGFIWNRDSTLYQAKVELNGREKILNIGTSRDTSLLKMINVELARNNLKFEDIVGTTWKIERIDRFDWKAILTSFSTPEGEIVAKVTLPNNLQEVYDALKDLAKSLNRSKIDENLALTQLVMKLRKPVDEIRNIFGQLRDADLIKWENKEIEVL